MEADTLARLNPILPAGALDDTRNRSFHRMLVDSMTVEYRADDGTIRGA